jgi:hypothetical protein
MTLSKRSVATTMAALALAVGAAACGDDDDDTTAATETTETASAEQVTVTTADEGENFTWEVSPTPTAETTTIEFVNDSEKGHALIFARLGEGYTVEEAVELQGREGSATTLVEGGAGPGQTTSNEVKEEIEPGNYVLLCPIEDKQGAHYKRGQLAEFEIN